MAWWSAQDSRRYQHKISGSALLIKCFHGFPTVEESSAFMSCSDILQCQGGFEQNWQARYEERSLELPAL